LGLLLTGIIDIPTMIPQAELWTE